MALKWRIPKKFKNKYGLVFLAGIIIIIIDIGVTINYLYDQHTRNTFIKSQETALGSQNIPSSVKPTPAQVDSYVVPPNNPRYLIIPAIGVNTRVDKLYTNAQNQILAPSNIYDAGWYEGSSLPGQPGQMFIDGHVSSWTADGVFYNLKKLKAGDAIEVVRGDNKIFNYTVKEVQTYDASNVNMTQVLTPIVADKPGISLMTCTGTVIAGTSQFTERLVVYGVLDS